MKLERSSKKAMRAKWSDLVGWFKAGRVAFAATGVVLAALMMASVSGCGTEAKENSSADTSEQSLMTPAPTGDLDSVTWNLPTGEPPNLDPAAAYDLAPLTVLSNLCDTLTTTDSKNAERPGIATDWKQDGRKTTYTIRSGVKFWDGTPLTASDVVASLQRTKADPAQETTYQNVKSIEKIGPMKVEIKFTQPDRLFQSAMTTQAGAIVQAKYLKEKGKQLGTPSGGLMCSGPFKYVSWQAGSEIVIERNDDYWNSEMRPQVKQVKFKFITDSSTLTNALVSGAIDGTYEAPIGSTGALEKSSDGTLHVGPSQLIYLMLPTRAEGPMADKQIREALNLSIDRDSLVETVFNGNAEPLRTIVPPSVWSSDPAKSIYQEGYNSLPALEQNSEEAKRLVQEAGAPQSPLVMMVLAGDQTALRTATFVQASAGEVGLPIKIQQLQATDYVNFYADPSAREGTDLIMAPGWIVAQDALEYAPLYTASGAWLNYLEYDNEEVNSELQKARASLEPGPSATAFVKAQKGYTLDNVAFPLVNQAELLYMNNRMTGAPKSFVYSLMPWAALLGKAE